MIELSLSVDPAMRAVVGERATEKTATSYTDCMIIVKYREGTLLKSIEHIDEPWSYEDIKSSYFTDPTKTEQLIKAKEGGVLWSKLSAVHDCLEILNSCANDALDTISEFSHVSAKPGFWNLVNRVEQERYTNQLKKHVYCAASAAGSFYWHSKDFAEKYSVDGLMQKRKECFEITGLNSFMRSLRNYVVHEKIVKANWLISWDANKTRHAKFVLGIDDLLKSEEWEPKPNKKSDEWKLKAKQFVDQNKDGIDVYQIFDSYLKCANDYYSWHKAKVIAKYSAVLKEYFVYERYLNKVKQKTNWNLIISQLKEGVDVFQYLDKYLTPQQIEDVLSYENGSQQQVDRLIEIIDVYKACDNELRKKIYSKLVRKT